MHENCNATNFTLLKSNDIFLSPFSSLGSFLVIFVGTVIFDSSFSLSVSPFLIPDAS